MVFKKLGALLVAALAIGALFAGTSQAQVWKVGGTKLASGESRAATVANASTSAIVIEAKVLGSPFKLTAALLAAKEGKISQSGFGTLGVSTLTGKLVFSGVTVDEPVGCRTSSTIEMNSLIGTAAHGNTAETAENVYVKVVPAAGEVFATLKLTECAAAGSYQIKGSFYVLAKNKTGTEASPQEGVTSGAITASQGGGLTLGKEALTLTGNIDIALTSGTAFGLVKE